ncbi:MAG: hypothetical protein KGZ80_12390 [Methylomonas sp.]|nr:hypothetical protein [Methylomonas sp.]PPD19830.1 MAG: hypothetical protein CTY23_10630 [Methylomonas sp.]PPD26665.1 MAG: hypothetical protein CTY22_04455 [Methylomonas sp.]PPD37324.1 MAG: hypothetical protein CTY17_10755 [Methylomonas sp.]PPD38473.1 MAG: hypothetical protein CTY21_04455 [Methylomonas sp.]
MATLNNALNQATAIWQQLDAVVIGGIAGGLLLLLIFLMYRWFRHLPPPAGLGVDATPKAATEAEPQPERQPVAASVIEQPTEREAVAVRPSVSALKGSSIEKAAHFNPDMSRGEAIKPSPLSPSPAPVATPEDSVLRRHYVANLAAQHEAIIHPYPTDSVLHRHYDTLHRLDMGTLARPVGAGAPLRITAAVPQDSVLRRHFIADLRSRIEAGLCSRPHDSVLRRHHDALIDAELHRQLDCLGG